MLLEADGRQVLLDTGQGMALPHNFLEDDQALFIQSAQGRVVILGCAYAGVMNTLHYIQTLTSARTIHTLIGGLHLLRASSVSIQATADALVQ